mmetsp:Transcript_33411/g.66062  ORF Transcript_33411/g.66062 Transcript_33411/m.66062 type:complete len:631 (+) Transcript_33411:644-2536(+)
MFPLFLALAPEHDGKGVRKTGRRLYGRKRHLPNIGRSLKPEDAVDRAGGDALPDSHHRGIHSSDVVQIREQKGFLFVEPARQNVLGVLQRQPVKVVEVVPVFVRVLALEQKLLVVRHLDDQGDVERLLQPLRHEEGNQVSHVHGGRRRPASGVEVEAFAVVLLGHVQQSIHVPVREEDVAAQEPVEEGYVSASHGGIFEAGHEVGGDELGPELVDELVVVDLPRNRLHVHHHLLVLRRRGNLLRGRGGRLGSVSRLPRLRLLPRRPQLLLSHDDADPLLSPHHHLVERLHLLSRGRTGHGRGGGRVRDVSVGPLRGVEPHGDLVPPASLFPRGGGHRTFAGGRVETHVLQTARVAVQRRDRGGRDARERADEQIPDVGEHDHVVRPPRLVADLPVVVEGARAELRLGRGPPTHPVHDRAVLPHHPPRHPLDGLQVRTRGPRGGGHRGGHGGPRLPRLPQLLRHALERVQQNVRAVHVVRAPVGRDRRRGQARDVVLAVPPARFLRIARTTHHVARPVLAQIQGDVAPRGADGAPSVAGTATDVQPETTGEEGAVLQPRVLEGGGPARGEGGAGHRVETAAEDQVGGYDRGGRDGRGSLFLFRRRRGRGRGSAGGGHGGQRPFEINREGGR